jgi:hypothetical protein
MSTPQNQEHLEADQISANERRKEFKKTLSPNDLKKLEVVEEVAKILENNKIISYLYAWLPSDIPEFEKRPGTWMWHTLEKHINFDQSGKITRESQNLINDISESLISTIIQQYRFPLHNAHELGEEFVRIIRRDYIRLNGGKDPWATEDNKEEE